MYESRYITFVFRFVTVHILCTICAQTTGFYPFLRPFTRSDCSIYVFLGYEKTLGKPRVWMVAGEGFEPTTQGL